MLFKYLGWFIFWLFWFTICLAFTLVEFLEYMSLDVWIIRFLDVLIISFRVFLKKFEMFGLMYVVKFIIKFKIFVQK
ncbi:unnamed protein product [Meloidogyne enterolobii]|uniref:Uncharacterized protein n=1 Tax=Meloidogyne enterolobii TaxID=390850 RepID=A0ACB0XVE2_MELEN